jgi:hypothetical protein
VNRSPTRNVTIAVMKNHQVSALFEGSTPERAANNATSRMTAMMRHEANTHFVMTNPVASFAADNSHHASSARGRCLITNLCAFPAC